MERTCGFEMDRQHTHELVSMVWMTMSIFEGEKLVEIV